MTYPENRGLLVLRKVSSVNSLRDGHLLSISSASSGFPIRNNVLAMLLYELPMRSLWVRRRISIALCPVSTAFTKSPNSVYAREMAFRLEAMKASSTDSLSLISRATRNELNAFLTLLVSSSISPWSMLALANMMVS